MVSDESIVVTDRFQEDWSRLRIERVYEDPETGDVPVGWRVVLETSGVGAEDTSRDVLVLGDPELPVLVYLLMRAAQECDLDVRMLLEGFIGAHGPVEATEIKTVVTTPGQHVESVPGPILRQSGQVQD